MTKLGDHLQLKKLQTDEIKDNDSAFTIPYIKRESSWESDFNLGASQENELADNDQSNLDSVIKVPTAVPTVPIEKKIEGTISNAASTFNMPSAYRTMAGNH